MKSILGYIAAGIAAVIVTGSIFAAHAVQLQGAPSYYDVRLEVTAHDPTQCDHHVGVKFTPLAIAPVRAGLPYETHDYLDQAQPAGKPVEDGRGNWECWQTLHSHDLAPGKWRITAEFPSSSQQCERIVTAGKSGSVRVDEEEGCVEIDRPGTEADTRKISVRPP